MSGNIIKDKSFGFALDIIKLYQYLQSLKEFVLSKQLLRSGTAIGALHREAEHAESKADFIHKMAIAQKECNETLYWLELLRHSDILDEVHFDPVYENAKELMRLLTSIIKTSKASN